jgi:hypothetical protein
MMMQFVKMNLSILAQLAPERKYWGFVWTNVQQRVVSWGT